MKLDPRGIQVPDAQSMALQIASGRAVIAAGILAAPVRAARTLGADTATAQRVTWLTRMMAIRDGALGVGGAAAVHGKGSAAPWLVGGAVSDVVDAIVLAAALKQGRIKGVLPSAIVPLAVGSAALGAVTAVRLRRC